MDSALNAAFEVLNAGPSSSSHDGDLQLHRLRVRAAGAHTMWLVYSFRLPAAPLVVTAIGFSLERLLSGASIRP